MRVLVLSSSLRPGSRSQVLAFHAREELERTGVDFGYVDLRDVDLPHCDGASAYGAEALPALKEAVQSANSILVASPVYNYDLNSAVKNVLELTGDAWTGKVVGFLLAAGGPGSYMSAMGFANSLMLDFRCVIVPRFVYVTGADFEEEELVDETVKERIAELCSTAVKLGAALA